jgi:hypothetical protein
VLFCAPGFTQEHVGMFGKWRKAINDALSWVNPEHRGDFGLIVLERDVGGVQAELTLRDPVGLKPGQCSLDAPLPWTWPLNAKLLYGTMDRDGNDLILGDPTFDEFFQVVSEEPLQLLAVLGQSRRRGLVNLVRELRRESGSLEVIIHQGHIEAAFTLEDKRKVSTHRIFQALSEFVQPKPTDDKGAWPALLGMLSSAQEVDGIKDRILSEIARRPERPQPFVRWLEHEAREDKAVELLLALHGFMPPEQSLEVVCASARGGLAHPRFNQIATYLARNNAARTTFDVTLPVEVRAEVLRVSWQTRQAKTPGLGQFLFQLLEADERLCAALVQCIRGSLAEQNELPGENLREVLFAELPELLKKGGKHLRREIVDVLCLCGEAEDSKLMLAVLAQRVDDNNALQIVQRLGETGNLTALSRLEELSRQEQLGPVQQAASRSHALIRARYAGAAGGGLTLSDSADGEEGRLTLVSGNQGAISVVQEGEEP